MLRAYARTAVDPEQHTVLDCLHILLEEEFAHHQYCVRDLASFSSG